MRYLNTLTRPPWRTLIGCFLFIGLFLLGYQLWTPGKVVVNGSHDVKTNGIWLQHGWLGDDKWFQQHNKKALRFRNAQNILQLKTLLLDHNITDVYPHLCPCRRTGEISAVNAKQTRQFLMIMDELRVIPWVGGVLNVQAFPESPQWRHRFIKSIIDLLKTHPTFAGIHVNIEPMPSGNIAYIELLRKLRRQLPSDKILSVAAYPPPTIYQSTLNVHWEKTYYEKVAREVDQMVIMMYDTSLRFQKLYQYLIATWTQEVLDWSGATKVLIGVPVYDDKGVNYHYPHVENLRNSLLGIHAGLAKYNPLPKNYKGIAIYSNWEMEFEEWQYLKRNYSKN